MVCYSLFNSEYSAAFGGCSMHISEIVEKGAILFLDKESDILITWDGQINFAVYAGKFDGDYDLLDEFYKDIKSMAAAREVAKMWFQDHSIYSPGP